MEKKRKRKHHFFKVLLGDFSQQMRIPPNFVKHISEEVSRTVFLDAPHGGAWRVEVTTNMDGWFLVGGWMNFVKDNGLQEFDFLVFRYEGKMRFSVQVFDRSACEREKVASANAVDRGYVVQQKAPKLKSKKIGVDRNKCEKKAVRSCITYDTVKVEMEEDEKPINPISSSERPAKAKAKSFLPIRRLVSLEEREQARKEANSFTSDFPCFITDMKVANVNRTFMLRIPTRFARAHLPRHKTQIVLRNTEGRVWVVTYIPLKYPNKRGTISGGWSAFTRENDLQEGDCCVFELVGQIELLVHIFRAAVGKTRPQMES